MKQSELCEALKLSKGQVSKLVARGMPTDSAENAEAWRRRNLEPMMVASHQAKKRPAPVDSTTTPNPIDAVLFGVLPQLLLDRLELLVVLVDAGIEPTAEDLDAIGAGLAGHLHRVLIDRMGFPQQNLNLPAWLGE